MRIVWYIQRDFCAIDESDDLEIRVLDKWVKVIENYTGKFLVCYFSLVINCTRGLILCSLSDIALDRSAIALFVYPSCV